MDDNVKIALHRKIRIPVFLFLFLGLLQMTASTANGYTELPAQPTEIRLVKSSFSNQVASQNQVRFPLMGPDKVGLDVSSQSLIHLLADKGPIESLDSAEQMAIERGWWWDSWPWLMIIVSSLSLIGYLLIHSRHLVNIGDSYPDD